MHGAGLGDIAIMIYYFFVIVLIAVKFVFVALITGIGLYIIRGKKSKETRLRRSVAIALLILMASLVIGELVPQAVDVPALLFPQMCELHWIFPFHLFGSDVFGDCYSNAAVFQKSAAICPIHDSDCLKTAIKAGAQDCSRIQDQSWSLECFNLMAFEEGDYSLCEKMDSDSCYIDVGTKIQDTAPCEESSYFSDCISSIFYNTKGNATCDNISNQNYKKFCLVAKKAHYEEACSGNSKYPFCLARYYADSDPCGVYQEGGLPELEQDCRGEVDAIKNSNASLCMEIYPYDKGNAAQCIYWVLRKSQNESVCDGLDGLFAEYCTSGLEALQNGTCFYSYSLPVSCIAEYSNNSSLCDLDPEDITCR